MQVVAELHTSQYDNKLDRMAKELVFLKKVIGKEFNRKSGKLTLEITKGKFKTVTCEEDIFAFCNEVEKKQIIEKISTKTATTSTATTSKASTPASDRLGRSAKL